MRFPWTTALHSPRAALEGRGVSTEVSNQLITIDGPIGWEGVDAIAVTDALDSMEGVGTITVRVNSPGGAAYDGVTIYNRLRRHPAAIRVVVDGLAASAASIVAMAGDEIVMAPGSLMMIHQAQGEAWGDVDAMLEAARMLDKANNSLAEIYQRRGGQTLSHWADLMAATTWFSGAEAVEAGLATAVEGDEVPAAELAAAVTASSKVFGYTVPDLVAGHRPVPAGDPATHPLPGADGNVDWAQALAAGGAVPPPSAEPTDWIRALVEQGPATTDYIEQLAGMATTGKGIHADA